MGRSYAHYYLIASVIFCLRSLFQPVYAPGCWRTNEQELKAIDAPNHRLPAQEVRSQGARRKAAIRESDGCHHPRKELRGKGSLADGQVRVFREEREPDQDWGI